ncbi:MAG: MATE family efflux transporter, partial [Firmicutes bacterium]|nr:MATE family efflux transporter [Bacillota bacterium]
QTETTNPDIPEDETEHERKEREAKEKEESRLNKPITYKFLLTFTIPTIISMLIMGAFGVVSQIFAARGISPVALASVNYVMPFFSFAMAIGAMLAMGGSALVVKLKGRREKVKARQVFTLLTIVVLVSSLTISVVAFFLRYPLLRMLGARGDNVSPEAFAMAMDYMVPIIWTLPLVMLGMFFVQFMIADGKPTLSLIVSSVGSLLTVGLNALFIFTFDMGVFGLALSTGIGYAIPAVIGAVYFFFNKKGTIYFVRPKWSIRAVGRSSLNGLSEAVGMMAMAITMIAMNNVLTDIIGWDGVAAAAVVLGVQSIFMSFYFGYSAGVAPIISYNYGKENHDRSKALFKKSFWIVLGLSVVTVGLTFALVVPIVNVFIDPYMTEAPYFVGNYYVFETGRMYLGGGIYGWWENGFLYMTEGQSLLARPDIYNAYWMALDPSATAGTELYRLYMCIESGVMRQYIGNGIEFYAGQRMYFGDGFYGTWQNGYFYFDPMCMQFLRDMSVRGMRIVAFAFVLMGFNVFASGLLTAFNDGIASGFLTAARTFLFTMVLLLTLPRAMGIDGAWLALPLAEVLALALSIIVVLKLGKKYKYFERKKKMVLVEEKTQ